MEINISIGTYDRVTVSTCYMPYCPVRLSFYCYVILFLERNKWRWRWRYQYQSINQNQNESISIEFVGRHSTTHPLISRGQYRAYHYVAIGLLMKGVLNYRRL